MAAFAIRDGARTVTILANCDRAHAESALAALIADPEHPDHLTLKKLTPWWAFWRP